MALQKNNGGPKGYGQPTQNKDQPTQNFMSTIGYRPPQQQAVVEPVAPGIPGQSMDSALGGSGAVPGSQRQPTSHTMSDPRSYIQSLLPQGPATPQALASIEGQLNSQGIQLQKNSAGEIRGRAYLPNPGGYQYGNAVDLVSQWGQPWSYREMHEDGPSATPKRSPAMEMYNHFQSQLMAPQQNSSNDLEQILMALLSQNQDSI